MHHPKRPTYPHLHIPSYMKDYGLSPELPVVNEHTDMDVYKQIKTSLPSSVIDFSNVSKALTEASKRKESNIEMAKLHLTKRKRTGEISESVYYLKEILEREPKDPAILLKEIRSLKIDLERKKQLKELLITGQMPRKKRLDGTNIISRKLKKVGSCFITVVKFLEPWRTAIQTIHAKYGVELTSYFLFVRWLIYLNVINLFISTIMLVIPQHFEYLEKEIYKNSSEDFQPEDIITGAGWLGESPLFYGYYSNRSIMLFNAFEYSIPMAYILSVFIIMLVNFFIIVEKLFASHRHSYFISSKIGQSFCNTVFSSWDYSITNEISADSHKNILYHKLMEVLSSKFKRTMTRTRKQEFIRILTILNINILVIFIISTGYALIYKVMNLGFLKSPNTFISFDALPALVIIIIMTCHYVLCFLFNYEQIDSKKLHLFLIIIRVALMRGFFAIILTSLWLKEESDAVKTLATNCYENLQGEQYYRLLIFNFIFTNILFNLVFYIRGKINNFTYYKAGINLPNLKFDISFHMNSIIYSQTLLWLGFYYSPLLSGVMILILMITFASTLYALKEGCEYTKTFLSATHSKTVYLSVICTCFIMSFISVFYTIFYVPTSDDCGPFTDVLTSFLVIANSWKYYVGPDSKLQIVVHIVQPPLLRISIICALFIVIYYLRLYANRGENLLLYMEYLIKVETSGKNLLLKMCEKELIMHKEKELEKSERKKNILKKVRKTAKKPQKQK